MDGSTRPGRPRATETNANLNLPPALSSWTGWLISKAAQLALSDFERHLDSYGLNPRHYGVLALLQDSEPLSQLEIGGALRIDRTTMVALIDSLEERNLVMRRRDPRDRRAYLIGLTEAGGKQVGELAELVAGVDERLTSGLTDSEREKLNQLLRKVLKPREAQRSGSPLN